MLEGTPSRTALGVAMRRAAHQVRDLQPLVLQDPLALRILGEEQAERLRSEAGTPEPVFSTAMRAAVVVRSRYAEDLLAGAVHEGVRQYVLLGAGLDTFAYRNPWARLHVFEVDHPTTQAWKRRMLEAGGIALPENLTLVPVDFERQSLRAELQAAGFREDRPAFFGWLGVVPYLTEEAFFGTLQFIASCAPGSGLVFDYGLPRESLPETERPARDYLANRVRLAGEPFRLFWTPEAMDDCLKNFTKSEELDYLSMNERYFSRRRDGLRIRGSGGRLRSAWVL